MAVTEAQQSTQGWMETIAEIQRHPDIEGYMLCTRDGVLLGVEGSRAGLDELGSRLPGFLRQAGQVAEALGEKSVVELQFSDADHHYICIPVGRKIIGLMIRQQTDADSLVSALLGQG